MFCSQNLESELGFVIFIKESSYFDHYHKLQFFSYFRNIIPFDKTRLKWYYNYVILVLFVCIINPFRGLEN